MTTRFTASPITLWLRTPRERLPKVLARLQRLGYAWRRFGFVEGVAVVELIATTTLPPVEFALVTTVPEAVSWVERNRSFHIIGHPPSSAKLVPCTAIIRIPLRLRKAPPGVWEESYWVLDGGPDEARSALANLDERVLRRFDFARVRHLNRESLVLRAGPHGGSPVLPPPFRGFVQHRSRPGIVLPAGTSFAPLPRSDRLGDALDLTTHSLVWIEDTPAGFDRHRLPVSAFRPLDELVSYTTPVVARAADVRSSAPPFAFQPFAQLPEPAAAVPPSPFAHTAVAGKPMPTGWLGRILAASRKAGKRLTRLAPIASTHSSRIPSSITRHAISRTGQKLIDRILNRTPATPPAEIAQMWADLAVVLSDTNHPTDAALCWVNAIWEQPTPPVEWLVAWCHAEEQFTSGTDGTPRLATSVLTKLGYAPEGRTPVELVRQLMELIETHESYLPIRAVWLAHLAAARASGGDTLGLARCRDRVFGRLTASGLALDIDAPSFLRSHAGVDPDGVRATHRWLTAVRDPIHRWIRKHTTGSVLGRAGLDAETGPTVAYADLILAWGFSRLGDRSAADRLMNDAKATLRHVRNERVHRTLLAGFQGSIRVAQGGWPDSRDARETSSETALTPLARYAVDSASFRLKTLGTTASSHPRRGLDLHPLFGSDPIGNRLAELVRTQSAGTVSECLSVIVTDPTARTLPRVTLALAELYGRLDPATATDVHRLLPKAIELLPEAVRLNGITGAGAHTLLVRLAARAIETGCSLASRYHLPTELEAVVVCLIDHLTQGDAVVRSAVTLQLPQLVTTLRKLGLTPAIQRLMVAAGQDGTALECYLRGQPQVAITHLNVLRDELFDSGRSTERQRTRSAFAYVASLAHGPPDLALDRLAEMFDRLDRIHSAGATARYFALRPLELIDAAVTAVVNDRFDLSPAARRWLDDDEFRIRKRIAHDLTAGLNGA